MRYCRSGKRREGIAATKNAERVKVMAGPNDATGEVVIVSTNADGIAGDQQSYAPVFSSDGKRVAFSSRATNLVDGVTNRREDIFVKDLAPGDITRVYAARTQGDFGGSGGDVDLRQTRLRSNTCTVQSYIAGA